jgi:5'-nucleotidase
LGPHIYDESSETVIDEKGNFSYRWGGYVSGEKNKGTDIDIVDKGYISVTLLQIDQTDFTFIKN